MHNQIDATIGDAIDLINCYSREDVTFEEIEQNMTKMYPELRKSNFRVSGTSISKFKLNEGQLFCSMTKLIQESKALATPYLAHSERIALGLNEETKFSVEPPGENGEESDAAPEPIEILCRDVLQNFIVHYFLASQIEGGIYEKIAGLTPAVNSCDLNGNGY